MSAEAAFRLGRATADHVRDAVASRPTLLLGTDTRWSGPMLAHAFTAGATSRGADVVWMGVAPTPAVSLVTVDRGFDTGVVVSASHNPFHDNGIKLFGPDGTKLADDAEADIERRLDAEDVGSDPTGDRMGRSWSDATATDAYVASLIEGLPSLTGVRLLLDCAHGAASHVARRVFAGTGAAVDVMNDAPNGTNINVQCGSTSIEGLVDAVVRGGYDVGVAFDGDADRALLVDRRGRVVTGDHVLAIVAAVRGDVTVVATTMTNLGVESWMRSRGIDLVRTQVGDRYVHEAMVERNLRLGGEQSGHVLFLDAAPTGDGLRTALEALAAVNDGGASLESWMDDVPTYPQRLVGVPVDGQIKDAVARDAEVATAVAEAELALGSDGRVVVRASGTEPLVRVMVEAPTTEAVDRWTTSVVEAVRRRALSR